MRRKWIWLLVGWLVVVGIVGCAQAVSLDTPAGEAVAATATALIPPTQVIQEETVAISPTIPIPSDPALQGLVIQAKEDLAQRFAIEVEQIGLVEAKAVEWPDASLGCPQPGMMYAQVITPGYRIVLEAGGQVHEYHADLDQVVVLCEEPLQGTDSGGVTSREFSKSGELPLFVEVAQTYLLPGSTLETPLTDLPPNRVFAFNPNDHILLLDPSIAIAPETAVLIGQTTVIQSPNETLVRGELFQVPLSGTGLIEVIAVDAETDALTLAYGDQAFELLPGQSRSFKQTTDQATAVVTIVTHAGRLAAIEPLPYSPGSR